jgi:nitrogen fixation protein NifU and related proteins
MFYELRDLYQEVILDHGRKPRHGKRLQAFDATARGDNPMCGDRVQVWVKSGPQDTISEVGFEARGCAISIASADLMAETVVGTSRGEARSVFDRFRELVRTGVCPDCGENASDETMQRLQPLAGVYEFPSRVKCATLPWHALMAALDGEGQATSE